MEFECTVLCQDWAADLIKISILYINPTVKVDIDRDVCMYPQTSRQYASPTLSIEALKINCVNEGYTYRISSPPALLLCNLFNSPLYLGDIDRLIIDDNSIAQNSADLAELVFVAGYEVEGFHFGDL